MANLITSFRIICSIVLLFVPAFSFGFYSLYLLAGFSDMIDGTVARRMHTASEFGSKLDTFADFVFAGVCFLKILTEIKLPFFLSVWIGLIVAIKGSNVMLSFAAQKKFIAVHSISNKITGFLLFFLPFTLSLVDLKISGSIVCSVAMFAAIQERRILRTGMDCE